MEKIVLTECYYLRFHICVILESVQSNIKILINKKNIMLMWKNNIDNFFMKNAFIQLYFYFFLKYIAKKLMMEHVYWRLC